MERRISDLTIEEFTQLLESTIIRIFECKGKRSIRPESGILPIELQTDLAKSVLKRGVNLKILDAGFMPTDNATRYQLKEFAYLASQMIGLEKRKWVVFENFWGIRNMAQIRIVEADYKAMAQIRSKFPELGYDKRGQIPKPQGFKPYR